MLAVAGCESLIGADFDEVRPATACETCTAGTVPVGAGAGGRQGGATGVGGGLGDAGRAVLVGGSPGVGGTSDPRGDSGDGGWAGDGNEPVDPCSSHAGCIDRHGGEAFYCRRSSCVRVTTEACPVLLPSGRALGYLRHQAPLLLGGFANVEAPDFEDTATVTWDLALTEFHDAAYTTVPAPDAGFAFGTRPLVAIVCNSSDTDFAPALRHLTETLGISGVLSTLPPEKLLAAYNHTIDPEYVENGYDPVFFLATNAADFRLANLVDRGLVWHMLGDPRALATTTAGVVRHIEPHVNIRRVENHALTGVDDPSLPLRLTLVTGDELSLMDAASVLTSGDIQDLSSNLTFNGELAILQPEAFRRVGIDAVEEILSNPPHIVVALAGPEIAGVIQEVESAWGLAGYPQGFMRPYWVLHDSASHTAELPNVLANLDLVTPPPADRLLGVSFALSQEERAQLLYAAYQSRLLDFYENERLRPVLAGTQTDYEAAYAMIYAYLAASRNEGHASATDLREALEDRVFSPEAFAESVSVGPAYVPAAMQVLGTSTNNMALYGSMGPPNFERSSGTRVSDTSVWCVEPANTGAPYVYDALLYNPLSDSCYAPERGAGSCAAQY